MAQALGKAATKCSAESLTLTATVNNRLQGYNYDVAGNMTNDNLGNFYTYDGASRIAQVNGSAVTYTYGPASGERVRKDINGQPSTQYYYFGAEILAERNVTSSAWTNYVFFDGNRVARRDSTGVAYYFSDELKTASVMTDAAGNIKSESDYYPWGGELQFANGDSNHYKFTSKERDAESGLDYFGARYYSNGLGRFITPDWSAVPVPVPYADLTDPQSLNQYTYVRNIPTSKVDGDGHGTCPPDCDVQVDMELVKQTLQQLGPGAGPALAAAGPAVVLAAPSVIGMGIAIAGPKFQSTDELGCLCPDNGVFMWPAPPANQPTPTPAPQIQPQPKPQPQAAAEHTKRKGSKKRLNDKHTKVDPGQKKPPGYSPDRDYVQPNDDKKKDRKKPPYHRKDRDPAKSATD